jgi:homoserine dehydrogenase
MATTTTTTPTPTTTRPPFKIGMIGAGTVGGGVYELIQQSYSPQEIMISTICVSDRNKSRSFTIDPLYTTYTTDPYTIYQDPTIDCVVEVMGGTTLAKEIIYQSIEHGKSVVTVNKALLAE